MDRARPFPERYMMDCSVGNIAGYEQDALGGYPAIAGADFHPSGE